MSSTKKSLFESPLLSTKVKSANVKLFPEGVLGYFLGPTLALLANSILSSYLNAYMTNVMNITEWANTFFTLLPVLSVICIVAGNIIVGRLMDHNKTRAGKARPLLLISVPLSILALLILFVFMPFTDESNGNQILALILLAIGYNLWFAIAYPFYYTSHAALISLSTRNSKDRSLLATISNATALAAMGLCSMILPFFLGLLFKYQLDPTALPEGALAVVENGVTQYYTTADGTVIYDRVASYNAWKIFVIALVVITVVGVLIEYYFTRERVTEESFENHSVETTKKGATLGQQAKVCFKDKYWWIIIVFFLMYQLGGMMKNVSQLYYCQAMFKDASGNYTTANGGTYQGLLSIIGAIPTAVGMVIAWPLSNKIGKGKAILCGSIISVIGGVIGLIFPENFTMVVISFVVKAFGSTPAMYLSLALLADVLDHQEAVHGIRTDGLTMTIYGAIMAGMTGIATGIMNGVLSATGYSASNVSTEALRAAIPWIFIGGETIGYGVIVLMFIFMGVEKFSAFDHKAIVADQKAQAEAEGREYVDSATALKREEEEAERASDEARKAELKAQCEKKGLNFEEEEAKYQKAQAEKKAIADAKAKANEDKKKAQEAQKQAQYDALTAEQKKAIEDKKAAQKAKEDKKAAEVLVQFNALRKANGKTELAE